jgi:hypothetical protein
MLTRLCTALAIALLAAVAAVRVGVAERPQLGDATAAADKARFLVIGVRSSAAHNLVDGFVSCENGFERKVTFGPVGAGFHRFTVDASHRLGVFTQMSMQRCFYIARLRVTQVGYDAKIAACAGGESREPTCDPNSPVGGMVGVQGSR